MRVPFVLAALLAVAEPDPPTPTAIPRRGLLDLELSPPSAPPAAKAEKPGAPPAAAPPPATPESIDAEIASLQARMARANAATMETIQPLPDLAAARERASEYRRRIDRMRRSLFVADPKPEGPTANELVAIQGRWGDLAPAILEGELPGEPIPRAAWDSRAKTLDPTCARRTANLARQDHVTVRGWAWACLSDAFFREFSGIEARAERSISRQRARATEKLDAMMRTVEQRLALADANGAGGPSPRLLLLDVTWLLRDVWIEAARLRIRELELQRNAGPEAPAFRWFRDMMAALGRSRSGGQPIAVGSGTSLKATSGKARAVAKVTAPRRTALSRKLHQVHYRLASVEPRVDDLISEELADYRMTVSDPEEIEALKSALNDRRAARIGEARQTLEGMRADTVAALAEEAK